MGIDLYVLHGSHPCAAVERALELKGLAFRRIELVPPLQAPIQKVLFGTPTVPAMRVSGGDKVSGSSEIFRRLDALRPDPPLFPRDGERRALVERAEEWGDEVWQPIARRVFLAALRRAPDALVSYAEGSRLPLPAAAIRAIAPLVVRGEHALHRVNDGDVRADLRALPRHLDRIDGWVRDGLLGGEPPNAADLQIAASTRLLLTVGDVAPLLAGRPAATHARAVFPPQPGSTPRGLFPAGWLAGSPASG